ncbi:MAG: hypothetical protein H7Y16_07380 [Candidatus Parcubacteria bacterium]|nr:hypothetical protein [Burkholderiales bacterium]
MSEGSRFQERVVLPGGAVLELDLRSAGDYRLACVRDGRVLVEYCSAGSYEFKSVEKLRYDFERDAENALRQG